MIPRDCLISPEPVDSFSCVFQVVHPRKFSSSILAASRSKRICRRRSIEDFTTLSLLGSLFARLHTTQSTSCPPSNPLVIICSTAVASGSHNRLRFRRKQVNRNWFPRFLLRSDSFSLLCSQAVLFQLIFLRESRSNDEKRSKRGSNSLRNYIDSLARSTQRSVVLAAPASSPRAVHDEERQHTPRALSYKVRLIFLRPPVCLLRLFDTVSSVPPIKNKSPSSSPPSDTVHHQEFLNFILRKWLNVLFLFLTRFQFQTRFHSASEPRG